MTNHMLKEEKSIGMKLKTFTEIKETETEFLLGTCVPKQSITLLIGDGGVGKSLIECSIAAALSNGTPTILDLEDPFDESFEEKREAPKTTLLLMAEDDPSRVIAGRLKKCGADLSKIYTPDLEDIVLCKLKSEELEETIAEYKPDLVIMDPLQSFLPSGVQMSQRNEMRSCLEPLNVLAEKYGTTFLITVHTNKRAGASGRNRMADSADIWDIARSALIVGKTGDGDVGYISHEKSNYGEHEVTVLFRIVDGRVQSAGVTKKKDYDFVNDREPKAYRAPKRDEAIDFIVRQLQTSGKMQVRDLDAELKAAGFSQSTSSRAKTELYQSKVTLQSSLGSGINKRHFIELVE